MGGWERREIMGGWLRKEERDSVCVGGWVGSSYLEDVDGKEEGEVGEVEVGVGDESGCFREHELEEFWVGGRVGGLLYTAR